MNKTFALIMIFVSSCALCCSHFRSSTTATSVQSPSVDEQHPVAQETSSNWQTVLLRGKGIKFKLPPDWQHEGQDSEEKNEYFTLEGISWISPNKELIRIYITTAPRGFVSSRNRTVISKEERLEEEFKSAMQPDSTISDVKKLKVSEVVGVFWRLHFDFKDKDIGERIGLIWKGYRIYQGKAQEVGINISGNPKSEKLLQAIFSTLELEQDRAIKAKP